MTEINPHKFNKVSEEAFFCVEPSSFVTSITPYNHVIANQTILFGWPGSMLITTQIKEDKDNQSTKETKTRETNED